LHIGASSADLRLHQTIRLTGKPVSQPLREHYFSITEIPNESL
jgi:beta-glucosidase